MPKVVFVVGPAGAATNGYRSQARAAAAIARRYTPDVIELYSPNATWPAVREALQGASLVVYMGHGNGFPSRYRDELYLDGPIDERSETIKNHGQKSTLRLLRALSQKQNITLMCHCVEDAKECHRFLLAKEIAKA